MSQLKKKHPAARGHLWLFVPLSSPADCLPPPALARATSDSVCRFRDRLTDTPRSNQLPGHPPAQSRWHIGLTIVLCSSTSTFLSKRFWRRYNSAGAEPAQERLARERSTGCHREERKPGPARGSLVLGRLRESGCGEAHSALTICTLWSSLHGGAENTCLFHCTRL